MTEERTFVERSEDELSWVGLVAAETIRAVELAVIALGVLLVCPPLLILLVVVVVPTIALAGVVALVASVFVLPVLAVRHFHRPRGDHAHQRVHRLARLGRAHASTATSRLQRGAGRALAKLGAHGRTLPR